MYFSERYGYKEISEKLNWEDMTDRLGNRLWSTIYELLVQEMTFVEEGSIAFLVISDKVKALWKDFLARPIDFIENFYYSQIKLYKADAKPTIIKEIRNNFLVFSWSEVYDLIEYLYNKFLEGERRKIYTEEINRILLEEKAPYKFIDGLITPLTNEEEIRELIQALNTLQDKYRPIKEHLGKALSLLSDRKNPDYANSIKESISALESLAQILLGEKGTLGDLIKKLDVHSALKQGFGNIYGWSSDEGGIRHGKTGEPLEPSLSEARYMLITSSAFVNYLIAKEESEKGL